MKHVQIITLGLLIISCSQNKQIPVTYQPSQLKNRELGYIVTLPANDAGEKIRAISESQHIYEVSMERADEISRKYPHAKIIKNREIIAPQHREDRLFEQAGQSPVQFSDCAQGDEGDQVQIGIANADSIKQKNGLIDAGQTIKFQAISDGEFKYAWYLIEPHAKSISGPFSNSVEFDFTPKGIGLYQVGLLAQDSDGQCGLTVVRVGFTANPELERLSLKTLPELSEIQGHLEHLNMIHAQKAWEISQGDGQIIAVVDSGVNYNHPYLNGNILTDSNGLVGWDFVQNDKFPFDDVGHGSHVAGLAAAQVFGVAPHAKILPVKVINIDGSTDMGTASSGIYYAVDHGATVINASFGGPTNSQTDSPIAAAFAYAEKKGVIIVTAAGNDSKDIDEVPYLPAGLTNANNITVAATDFMGALAPYSNFGAQLVKVAAPGGVTGKELFSAEQVNDEGELFWGAEGTSMAAPVVSGLIALIRSHYKNADVAKVNQILLNSGPVDSALNGKVESGRVIDALDALSQKIN